MNRAAGIRCLDAGATAPIIRIGMTDSTLNDAVYRVLARKYRPMTFADMIGQEAMVRTLTNAMKSGRLAHAFVLTGVRGVGKTTTARIIARALNCIGPDGSGGPTVEPCGECEPCRTIAADRNVDVMEMDAASRTGVDDIREIIDGVRYAPVAARYKVYIIDEVHMLSKNAFNALLKTLEEPPPHVTFVFATTEIRKVPITVLSRCQRFDLRRIDAAVLAEYFADIAKKESVAIEADALALIARAADGSARDGLSLLDQAIAQDSAADGAAITADQVRDMLGLADRTAIIDLFEALAKGEAPRALDRLAEMYRDGADPLVVLQDLLDFTHFLTRAKLVPDVAKEAGAAEAERVRGTALAQSLGMPALSRAWQMLLKGVGEVQSAPSPQAALEMVLIRLMHASGLPTPGEVIARLEAGDHAGADTAPGNGAAPGQGQPTALAPPARTTMAAGSDRSGSEIGPAATATAAAPAVSEPVAQASSEPPPVETVQAPADFRGLVALFEERGDPRIQANLYLNVELVHYEPGRLEFHARPEAPKTLASQVAEALGEWTGRRWVVSVSREPGEPSLSEQDRVAQDKALAEAAEHPTVRAVLDQFPGARIEAVHDLPETPADDGPPDPIEDD